MLNIYDTLEYNCCNKIKYLKTLSINVAIITEINAAIDRSVLNTHME